MTGALEAGRATGALRAGRATGDVSAVAALAAARSGAAGRETAISADGAVAGAAGRGCVGAILAAGTGAKGCAGPGTGTSTARGMALTSRTFTGVGAPAFEVRLGKLSHTAAPAWMPTDKARAAAMREPASPPMLWADHVEMTGAALISPCSSRPPRPCAAFSTDPTCGAAW